MHLMNYFSLYQSGAGRTSLLHQVPIKDLDQVRLLFAKSRIPVKIRFRGPRAHRPGRTAHTRSSSCLKADAVTFAVYRECSRPMVSSYS